MIHARFRFSIMETSDFAGYSFVNRTFSRLKGIMIGRGLLSSPWLATEYISDTPLTAQEKIEKLSAFHTLLLAGYSSRLEGGEHQVLDKMKTLWDYLLPDAEKRLRKKY